MADNDESEDGIEDGDTKSQQDNEKESDDRRSFASFSMAQALSMVRRRQEEKQLEQSSSTKEDKGSEDEKREKARAKRRRRRQNQKLARAKARAELNGATPPITEPEANKSSEIDHESSDCLKSKDCSRSIAKLPKRKRVKLSKPKVGSDHEANESKETPKAENRFQSLIPRALMVRIKDTHPT